MAIINRCAEYHLSLDPKNAEFSQFFIDGKTWFMKPDEALKQINKFVFDFNCKTVDLYEPENKTRTYTFSCRNYEKNRIDGIKIFVPQSYGDNYPFCTSLAKIIIGTYGIKYVNKKAMRDFAIKSTLVTLGVTLGLTAMFGMARKGEIESIANEGEEYKAMLNEARTENGVDLLDSVTFEENEESRHK